MITRRQLLQAAAAVPLAAAGCSHERAGSASGAREVVRDVIHVGSPTIPPSITLTPHTIIVPDGARAIAGLTTDRKALRLAAGTPAVSPGSVVVLTDVGVFRAQAVERSGDQQVVTPAPCAIHQLIADGGLRFQNVRITPRAGATTGTRRPTGRSAAAVVFDRLSPTLHAQDSGDTSGKIGDYDYRIQYNATDDAVTFDASASGDVAGFETKLTANGHLSGFDVSGGVNVRRGAPESLALLVKSLVGEVNLEATASRHDNAAHPGQQMLKIPKEYVWPLVIDGIPFLLKLGVALLLNEGLTNTNAQARFGVKLTFKGSSGFDMKLPGEPKEADPKIDTALDTDYSFTHAESVGLGPQALLVAMQCPRLAFGLGLDLPFVDVFAGPYIDVVTAASHTASGAAAIVACQRNQLVITGAVGCEGKFLLWEGDMRKEAYRKEIVRAVPDTKACRLE